MERAWAVASILCLVVAGVLLLVEKQDAAFAVAMLGVVAWFLGYRVKLRGSIAETVEAADDETDASEDHDEN